MTGVDAERFWVDAERFWEVAEPFLANGAEQSTMMGNPCLRIEGAFFASMDRRNGELVVKLPAARVDELIEQGAASSFSPNGRRFKEWAAIPTDHDDTWPDLIAEALAFANPEDHPRTH